ncbi:MAG: acyl-CoA dehydrogenase family protein [Dehalococcoidia bacterium]|nr:acyl-CoA dehydrogenase family protein [Dehalococcoidia bacterium]
MQKPVERIQERLHHDSQMPEELVELRSQVRRFAEDEIAPVSAAIEAGVEEEANFPSGLFRRMAELGHFRLPFTKEEGGGGYASPMLATAIAMEELGYYSNTVAVIYDCQCVLAGRVLQYATPELKMPYLSALMSGEKVACVGITEPDAGSDVSPSTVSTMATATDTGWVVTGRKRFIINAPIADFGCVLCNMDGSLGMLVIDLKQEGVSTTPPDRKLGMHGCLTSDIVFNGVSVPRSNLVWKEGKGLRIALGALTRGRIAVAASGVGMAQAAFDESVDYMKRRQLFGKTLAGMQYWQFKMAERATQIGMARDMTYKAALRHDAGEEFPEPETGMAKYYATQLAADMGRPAVQIFGGYGFMSKLGADGSTYRVEQIYRDSKGPEIYEGSNEIQKLMIARQIFGKGV